MYSVDSTTDFESSASALTAAPSNRDLWSAIDWVARGVAEVPPEHKRVAARGVLVGLLNVLPPAPEGRRAVFHSRRGSEVR